ncbi:MAG TPA: twin-arginine translocase TatA/TatE family subunit [Candidatus Limnocylindrales bacterium]|nr:twin-arginine translocase TatA/TatE family subunit [Candidatus Limnocylindrales bacterium]
MSDILLVLIVILILVLIWRGPKTLPEIGRMFGRGVREARIEANKLRSNDDDKPADGGTTSA